MEARPARRPRSSAGRLDERSKSCCACCVANPSMRCQTTSPGTGKPYGLERVCRVLELPRSTIYAQRARETAKVVPLHPVRRGPKPKVSDADLLAAIRADLEASPFVGEGHRKVWTRLRILSGIRVSKDRVCRLMRENALLSPHRVPQGAPSAHDGSIQAEAPNQVWGTDGIRIQTVAGWLGVGVLGGRSFRCLLRRQHSCCQGRQSHQGPATDCPGGLRPSLAPRARTPARV